MGNPAAVLVRGLWLGMEIFAKRSMLLSEDM